MDKSVFVNEFISLGLEAYFGNKSENVFEKHIIECLCDIYGEDRLKRVYDIKDENGFITLMHTYGLSRSIYDNFLRDTIKFEMFKESLKNEPTIKSDIASKVEMSVITMFLYKCLLSEPTIEEISHFENNLLNNFQIIKIHFNTSIHPNKTREVWEKKKKMITESVELVEIKPEYLDEFTYAKFGTSLSDVKKMDYRMVEELNKYIKSKIEVTEEIPQKKKTDKNILQNTVLSTGNGFVDALLIAGVIATEISVALIYMFLKM